MRPARRLSLVGLLALCACPSASPSDSGADTASPDAGVDTADSAVDTGDTGVDTGDSAVDTAVDSAGDSAGDTGDSAVDPADVDDDGDGYTENGGDCDDTLARVNPAATERCPDGVDDNCDGQVDEACGEAGLAWLATQTYDGAAVTATIGLQAVDRTSDTSVCRTFAALSGSVPAEEPCPDCDWAFQAEVTGLLQEGDACTRFTAPTFFDYAAEDAIPWATYLSGVGWGDTYVYTYATTTLTYTENLWFLYAYDGDTEWILFAKNTPGGTTYVSGDSAHAEVVNMYLGYYYAFYL